MNRGLCLFFLLSSALPSVAAAQAVDVSICDVLSSPLALDGKIVRLRAATAVARFDEFVIETPECGSPGAIWLAYPNGTKAKAGPVALVRLQLARNAPAVPEAPKRTPVTLLRDEQFARFDSLLATPLRTSTMCLGCPRYTVSATIVGRLDVVSSPGLSRDESGKVKSLAGFGNLNMYGVRLVVQSVSEVVAHEIDYAATTTPGDSRHAHSRATADQLRRSASAYGEQGEDNGVIVGFGVANEIPLDESAKGTSESPDGVLFRVTFDMTRLNKDELRSAMAHNGTHIADLRERIVVGDRNALEDRAWRATFR